MVSTTDNHGLRKYSQGEEDWDHGDTVNQVELGTPIRDVESNVNNYEPNADSWFWATDSNAIYTADGSSWTKQGEWFPDTLSLEEVRDEVAAFVQAGNGTTVTHDDGADTLTIELDVVETGSETLSGGTGTATTSVTTDSDHYEVFLNPDNADVSMSFDGSGTEYQIHFEEVDTSVGNPTVGWALVRL